jgi:chemosensory pili system protein ChpC
MQTREKTVRSVLLPITTGSVLLPHSAMLDVLPEREIKPVKNTPGWVLGEVSWNNHSIPLVAMEKLFGGGVAEQPKRSRIVIVTCLTNETDYQYLAIRTTKVPRLAQLSEDLLKPKDAVGLQSNFIRFYGDLNDQTIIIPDMEKLEAHILVSNAEKIALDA